jgi:hypothetical protein
MPCKFSIMQVFAFGKATAEKRLLKYIKSGLFLGEKLIQTAVSRFFLEFTQQHR